ncbi:MAG: Gldg family protein [Treponema sp.]|nr:Gldg family protein [Treponema sp.]
MKKLLNWLKSPKSDFALFVIFLVLLNLAAHKAFVRFDLTAPKSYSLSSASKSVVKNLEQPLSIRVFFDENLPTDYSAVHQYVKDILSEYNAAANKNFSVSHMNMKDKKNIELAQDLGVYQIQIQEVKNNEVGFKQGYMGIVVAYGDAIEVLNPVTTSDGFEYLLTSTMSKMISRVDTLNGLKAGDKITLNLYLSNDLKALGIAGAEEAQNIVREAFDAVNKQNMDRLEFICSSPSGDEVDALSEKYGVQTINYRNASGLPSKAALGLVLNHGEDFYSLPFQLAQSFFGYAIEGLDDVEASINFGLQSLLSNVKSIGYITGHGELDHSENGAASNIEGLISGMYELVDIDLYSSDIPTGMNSIIINGPQMDYTEEELYKIDQFLMRGGNVLFFMEGLMDSGANASYGIPDYVENECNVKDFIENYGVKINADMVMDKNCYTQMNTQYGTLNLYWAPVLHKEQMAKKSVITNNLGFVVSVENSSIDVSQALENKDVKVTVLTKSSDQAWAMTDGIVLSPLYMDAPADKSAYSTYNFTALLEGKFKSAFDGAPGKIASGESELDANNHVSASLMPGKVFVAGTSGITSNQVIAADGSSPAGMFLMNVIDYMNGHEELCTMRTKMLAVNNLTIKHSGAAAFWKYFEQFGLAIILVIVWFIVWRARTKRRKAINKKYNPDDKRTIN